MVQAEGSLARTVRFVAFSNEEQPFCRTEQMGSRVYANSCRENHDEIAAMICLETIGYYTEHRGTQKFPEPFLQSLGHDVGNFIAIVSNLESEALLEQCVAAFRSAVRFPAVALSATETVRGVDYSDHQNFWRLGYPAVMFTDTAFFRYPHYHQKTDTADRIDFDRLAVVTSGVAAAIIELGGASC